MKFAYAENDPEFERWSGNLFRKLIENGTMKRVEITEDPDMLFVISSTLRRKPEVLHSKIPLVLISNEAWNNFYPPCGPERFKAILGCCPFPGNYPTFIQFPYYAVHFDEDLETLLSMRLAFLQKPKTKFCCFVASNDFIGSIDGMFKRMDIFDELNAQKSVDAAGHVRNNTGYLAPKTKYLEWISDYKFMICLENTKINPEYLTEKPFQAWFAGTVPIYDGSAAHMLNRSAFVDASASVEQIINEVLRLDADSFTYELIRHTQLTYDIRKKFSLEQFHSKFLTLISN